MPNQLPCQVRLVAPHAAIADSTKQRLCCGWYSPELPGLADVCITTTLLQVNLLRTKHGASPELPGLADLRLEVVPGAVAQLGYAADDEAVLLLSVRLALVGAVRDLRVCVFQHRRRAALAHEKASTNTALLHNRIGRHLLQVILIHSEVE